MPTSQAHHSTACAYAGIRAGIDFLRTHQSHHGVQSRTLAHQHKIAVQEDTMKMPTALAPTAHLATPRVGTFVDSVLLPCLGPNAKVTSFELCNPPTNTVCSPTLNETWTEANWQLEIETDHLKTVDLSLPPLSDIHWPTIAISDHVIVHPKDTRTIRVRLWLYARVMR